MNSYHSITTLVKDILLSDEDINTCLFGLADDEDLYKKNIYPFARINPLGSNFASSQMNTFDLEITVLDQRDLSNSNELDKFDGNDNEIDNLNTTHAVINRLITTLRQQSNDDRIELISVSTASPVLFKRNNLMDGWQVVITLGIPNDLINVCN